MSEQETGTINDPKMPITQHLEELRKRVIIILGTVLVVFVGCWGVSGYILAIIEAPVLAHVDKLQFDTVTDPFFTHLKAAFFASVFLTFPVTLSQIWLFVSPGLFKREKTAFWPFLLISYPLFVGGGLFVYLVVFPFAFEFLINFDPTLTPSLRIGDYLSFTVRMIFIFGSVFEMPLISLLLTRMGLLTPGWLARKRRYAIVVIFIAAAILTPPDAFTQLLLAGPLLILYELSIAVSWLALRRDGSTKDDDD